MLLIYWQKQFKTPSFPRDLTNPYHHESHKTTEPWRTIIYTRGTIKGRYKVFHFWWALEIVKPHNLHNITILLLRIMHAYKVWSKCPKIINTGVTNMNFPYKKLFVNRVRKIQRKMHKTLLSVQWILTYSPIWMHVWELIITCIYIRSLFHWSVACEGSGNAWISEWGGGGGVPGFSPGFFKEHIFMCRVLHSCAIHIPH